MPTFLPFRRAGLARSTRLLLSLVLLLPLTALASVGKVVIAQGRSMPSTSTMNNARWRGDPM